ncbi:MAG: glycosyl transferase [Rhizobiales bacterium 17-65-6]|nr:MAG: glycosyl transferase [Rhizobiales bacterium 17-65-6]
MHAGWRARPASLWSDRKPIRDELFSVDRLEEHARSLARAQAVAPQHVRGHALSGRLAENGAALLAAYRAIARAIDEGGAITPSAEWLIDNYHLVEKQIREIRSDLPPSYYRQLPKLAAGPFAGYPRVFGVAWAFVAHTDSRFDPDMLTRFLNAYQEVQPLTIGELWAVSITLRIVLIENLRRLARLIVEDRALRRTADALADRLLGAGRLAPELVPAVLAAFEKTTLPDALAVQLVHRLRDQDPRITPALKWLDQHLAAQGSSADAIVRDVQRSQGASNVTVRNIITSLRLISDVDWKDLFERASLVDGVLAAGSAFLSMDFSTRNLYRSAIEELGRGSGWSEFDVATKAVRLAQEARAADPDGDVRAADPGYHLLTAGRAAFEAEIGFRLPLTSLLARLNRAFGMAGYSAAILFAAGAFLALPLVLLAFMGLGLPLLALLAVLGAIPAIDAAVAVVNRAVSLGFGAVALPTLELRSGIPSHLRTLVVVPTLLTTPASVDEQVEHLEIHHLASPEGDLHFALLSDWVDADSEHMTGDGVLVAAAQAGIDRLNARYGPAPAGPRFLLLHRRRIWNAGEGRWMGWERKRGKLHELNRLLRGADDTTFMPVQGRPVAVPEGVRYVVTLDADTRLPHDTVRRLIGKMAHPLNTAHFDAATGRVVEGYGVLQPRVTPSLPLGGEGSLFQRTFSSMSGIDGYGSAVSDVYQDLSGEGSYAGKGIYDVDAFEAALAGRVPDSTLLSHDLFEGLFARAGLASDVEVVEEFPARYDVDALRRHRWARGDWQLLPWILGPGPRSASAAPASLAIPAMGRLKMLDNLRRTLSAPFAVAALVLGWTLPWPAALAWTAFVVLTLVVPKFIPVLAAILPRHGSVALGSHLRALAGDVRLALFQSFLTLVFLAHEAWLMGDAMLRTLWRLLVSRRHLLEWVPAAQAGLSSRPDLAGSFRRMAGALLIAAVALAVAVLAGHGAWPLAALFAAFWVASPALARWVSLPQRAEEQMLSEAEASALRLTGRRTWRFFETFVTAADTMLPPDNFQEEPAPEIAHRTSPTNIGLYLLSVASARDFGWIGTQEAVKRLEATFATLHALDQFRGHFYNWYDTRDLRPLDPRYVSTVDSGNLAGHLIALAGAIRDWQAGPLAPATRMAGIVDALDLARQEAILLDDGRRTQTVTLRQLDEALEGMIRTARTATGDTLSAQLDRLAADAGTMLDIARALATERGDAAGDDMLFWAQASLCAIETHRTDLSVAPPGDTTLATRLDTLAQTARGMALGMDFGFLLDRDRNLLSIGFLAPEGTLDSSCYDLLASEARLASFFAIAKGDIPARHWFRLGRSVTPVAHGAALISWSGSMFEYLMPSLVMRAPAGSLLDRTNRLIVRRQIDYAATLDIPWGISESAYNARNLEFTYQYSNFGVPGLGLKQGLGDNRVIAPYATALASMAAPRAACANLARLARLGARGRYGFYEALDYTPSRLPPGESLAIVRAFMAHHQGMTLVAIADTLLGGIMRTRFHAEPMVQATELLLQERTPRDVAVVRPWATEVHSAARVRELEPASARRFASAEQQTPATHLMSNGRYAAMVTTAGSGYSRWNGFAVTRWREDATCDDLGSYLFVRDVRSGQVWSAGMQPSGTTPDDYHVAFHEDRAEFSRHDGTLETTLDVLVSAEDDAEVRRVSFFNSGHRVRELEVTSYAELVLAPQASDVAHPAFSKLFVQTEYLPDIGALLATRRKRSPGEADIWAAHFSVLDGEAVGRVEVETDRARFLGRGHGLRTPLAVMDGRTLSNTVGTVLDPVFALRRRIRIEPGAVARIAFWTMAASTRAAVLVGIDRHRDTHAYARAATLAWTQAQVELHHLGISAGDAALFQQVAGYALYTAPTLRPASASILQGAGPQSGLWAHGISGDLPIVLLRISDMADIDIAHQLLKAQEYWRMKQFAVDLVILNERQSSYVQDLQSALETLARTSQSRTQGSGEGPQGRVYVLRSDLMPPQTGLLLSAAARVVLVAQRGTLAEQVARIVAPGAPARRPARPAPAPERASEPAPVMPELEYFNGLGGFAQDGREYVTVLGAGQSTPAPWINVVANPDFGFQVASEGSGYTWSRNSRENQITPWSNDPVTDRTGEALYLRDDETGFVWTPTAAPIRDDRATYLARHGRGYSGFAHTAQEVAAELVQFVPAEGAVKISRLTLRNLTGRPRRISVFAYVEWVLGQSRPATAPFVATGMDADTGAMFARNGWNPDFGSRVAFLDMAGHQTSWTGDRREFIGRNGTLADPAALGATGDLSNVTGAGLDPCGAMRTRIVLPPHGSAECVVLLGEAADVPGARDLIRRYRASDLDAVLTEVTDGWDKVLGTVEVRTPDRTLDIMLNGWLLYQTLACRVWARSAFYQASGAYGFRDQLQDGMALAGIRPDMTRAHLLRAAARQFVEGDVQHWWLPQSGRGVRTLISDDRAWLAYATAHYVTTSADSAVLDEQVPFLEGQKLAPGEHESFFPPGVSDVTATLFEHCARALDRSLGLGGHGLPLMGTGDWNDGMNRVGERGEGESVWLGWFLYATLDRFIPLAEARGETERAATWRTFAAGLKASLERVAWDGDWYRRGFFDDGTAFGSAASEECRIDSIAQSWAVLSGAAEPGRARQAMASVERELILPGEGIALLFTPPFDKTALDPGYIKGYPPGIRENGGQYTHAALWSVMAFAALGEGDKAAALFWMLNPINHARSRSDVLRYKVEPYVLAADVYSEPPHAGRGGWTWYTGSAGWMQRAGIESILGLRIEGGILSLDPCIPRSWPQFEITVRHGAARYVIAVDNPAGVARGIESADVDGVPVGVDPLRVPLSAESGSHLITVRMG